MYKIPISGGPCTGKTTLIEALKAEYEDIPQVAFIPEPAEYILKTEQAKANRDKDYQPLIPENDYPAFARINLDRHVELEAAIPPDVTVAIQDRSIVDTLAYDAFYKYFGLHFEARVHIYDAMYHHALICEPLGFFHQNAIRREKPEDGALIHTLITEAYRRVDVPVTLLPSVSVDKRVDIVSRQISSLLRP